MITPEKIQFFQAVSPIVSTAIVAGVGGWVITTWMRIKNGYPLEGSWGQTIKPLSTNEDKERIKLIGSENAQLRAELAGVKDRLAVLERIATDSGSRLSQTIDDLRDTRDVAIN